MDAVIKEINDLKDLLESKIEAYEVKFQLLSKKQKEAEELEVKLQARKNNLSAMERIYRKYADFDKEKTAFAEEQKKFAGIRLRIEKDSANFEKENKAILKASADLDKKKADLTRQVVAFKQREADFEAKKGDLKDMISGKAIKDILK